MKKSCLYGVLILLLFVMIGCRCVQPIVQTRDSVHVEYRRDSVFIMQHDSIFRDRWRNGDTVFVITEKWRTQYKDKTIEAHDTITANIVQTVEVQVVPKYYKRINRGFWILLAILVLIIAAKVIKIYIRRHNL